LEKKGKEIKEKLKIGDFKKCNWWILKNDELF
jgi:hypothetical protein